MSDAAALTPEPPKRVLFVPGIRVLRILWRMLGPLALVATVVGCTWLLGGSDTLMHQAQVTGLFVLAFSLVGSMIREVLSPKNDELRMVDLKAHRALRMMTMVRALMFVLLGTQLAIWLIDVNGWNPSVVSLLTLLRNCGLVVLGWMALSRSWVIRTLKPEDTDTYMRAARAVFVRAILPLALLTTLFVMVVHALGYQALSQWVLERAGWTALIILAAVLVHRFLLGRLHAAVSFIRDESLADGEEAGTPWWIGVERIFAGTIKLAVIVGTFFLLLGAWDLSLEGLGPYLDEPMVAGIGNQTWGGLIGSALRAFTAYLLYTLVRNLLIFIVFPRLNVELGARYAMLTVLRYAAVVVIGLLILGALGVNSDTLTVFAGGATVGLAFGLKDIFSNFFSGLIMLLERPVRVGDTVEIDATKGKIEAVRLRGTTIRTFDGTTVIVPNTDMIGSRLANLTHGFKTARMQVDVGVSYDEDPSEVERILLEVARKDPRVLNDPAPVVRFNNFGDSALDFSLRVWTEDLGKRWGMVSDLRSEIFDAFKKADIGIPFPQTDLHIRSDFRSDS